MTRVIKFRGQRLDNRDWVVGSLAVSGFRTFILVYRNEETPNILSSWTEFEVDPKTVGQFTGLMDVELYEGDVFHLGDPKIIYVVEWIDSGLRGRQVGNKSTVGLDYWQDKIEIIGSVHTNPELLNA